ncbi:glucose-6-phosphate 1-dehydrogenase [Caulobacter ginsengisoli]|uniref:Glucose-6-phosphate 1-dehydrogenase n=1 Tax=Caulobacter ginsengisoli TaxID=400775 RepID=A0ABU0IS58_9CAUL|nr:glucose-6-phosphate dehydrogenase [Caulobacter ginsengisoli]MDQ0464840.1 glucose-6-phosphate 1-dehydrogenase [Caulobacter ginsengisoli]
MPDPSPTLVLLGGGGDLARRMLLPSLCHLDMDGLLPEGLRIVGVGRAEGDAASYREEARQAVESRETIKAKAWEQFAQRLDYCPADVTKPDGAKALAERIGETGPLVIFFALSPSLYAPVCKALQAAGLTGENTRLVLEKPIGHDLDSSLAINAAVAAVVPEERTFRIDHYLGKDTVQNLIALRFGNILFEPLWTSRVIDHVQITVAETEAVADRWPYYDAFGAMRDMLQNHMLQLLCLVAMEPPINLDPDGVRDEKVKVLKSLRRIQPNTVREDTVRGQYGPGNVGGKPVKAYADEVGQPTRTETFVAMHLSIDNWRWAGVPFFLRTGKRLPERRTNIVIQFKDLPHSIFGPAAQGDLVANRLVIDLQPDEDIKLTLMNKSPGIGGEGMRLQALPLSLSLAGALGEKPDRRRIAYERLLLDVFRGDRTLFVRRDEVEEAWRFVDAVADAWDQTGMVPKTYAAGTWGPSGVYGLIERDGHGRTWHE